MLNLNPKLLDASKGRGEQRIKDTPLGGVHRPWSVEAHPLSVARRFPDPIAGSALGTRCRFRVARRLGCGVLRQSR